MNQRKWKELRREVFKRDGERCWNCGAEPLPNKNLHVDHIKPRSKFPELALEFSNLRVLCAECNTSKGAGEDSRLPRVEVREETLRLSAQGSLIDLYYDVEVGNPYLVDDPTQAVKYLLTQLVMDRMVLIKFQRAFEADSTFKISQTYQLAEKRLRGEHLRDEDAF